MQPEHYRKRALDVRRAAQANLLAIRQARMARKANLADMHADQGTPDHPDESAAMQPVTGPADESVGVPDAGEVDDMDALDALAAKNAGVTAPEPEDAGDGDIAQSDAAAVTQEEPQENAPLARDETWTQSELAQLPGAGPGLVWMLGQCGVTTMAQLAQEEAQSLSTKLGVVGQILDVSQWISFAQKDAEA
ncbi:MAG: hypothetical protein AAFN63_04010 [Pseudomonadota bacterium]